MKRPASPLPAGVWDNQERAGTCIASSNLSPARGQHEKPPRNRHYETIKLSIEGSNGKTNK